MEIMNSETENPTQVTEYLIRLGNPYAKLSILDPPNDDTPLAGGNTLAISSEAKRRAYIKKLENPWANEGVGLPAESLSEEFKSKNPEVRPSRISKEEFRETCRRIFTPYAPAGSRSLLPDHRDFIIRNEVSSAERRFMLVQELKKYDITSSGDFQTWFNREPRFFTLEKLKQIEESTQQLKLF